MLFRQTAALPQHPLQAAERSQASILKMCRVEIQDPI